MTQPHNVSFATHAFCEDRAGNPRLSPITNNHLLFKMLTFLVPPLSTASPSGEDHGWGFQFLSQRLVEFNGPKCFKIMFYNLLGKNVSDFENWKCGCFLHRKWKVGEGTRFCFCLLVLTRAVLKSRRTICHEAQESQTVPCHANASWHIFFFSILIFFLHIRNFSNLSKDFFKTTLSCSLLSTWEGN